MPALPEPVITPIPEINIPEATGWPENRRPLAAGATKVNAYATDLKHPRWIYVLPNGDVLVAESASPRTEPEEGGIRGYFTRRAFKKAGSAVPSANQITLLRDGDGDGVAEMRSTFADSLYSPFGMALVGNTFYVANADGIVSFPYRDGAVALAGKPKRIAELPAGRNHHWTKNIIASRDGTKLYATVGSNSNVAEHGMQEEEGRAAIWEIDLASGARRLFATGLRNPNGMVWEPTTGALWTVVNERDELGPDLVPDYLTSVVRGGFYGWPWSYFGAHVDERVKPENPEMATRALVPDYALGSHVAALGLATSTGSRLPEPFRVGMFIGLHGSWNRDPLSGYKVIFVPFAKGRPAGQSIDVLTGFVEDGKAYGRPVGVAIDRRGALLVADDVGNTIWRVSSATLTTAQR